MKRAHNTSFKKTRARHDLRALCLDSGGHGQIEQLIDTDVYEARALLRNAACVTSPNSPTICDVDFFHLLLMPASHLRSLQDPGCGDV
jgi:hypothetical protein